MDWDFVERSSAGLSSALQEISDEMNGCGLDPTVGSQASKELRDCPNSKLLKAAYARGNRAWFVSVDHAYALEKVLTNGVLTLSPWTLARVLLESCSRACWILDTEIDYRERVARSLNFTFREIDSSSKYANKDAERNSSSRLSSTLPSKNCRIKRLIVQAGTLRIQAKRDKNGNVIGFEEGLPSITALTDSSFRAAHHYALLSAAAHGADWAVMSLGMQEEGGNNIQGGKVMQANISPGAAVYLINLVTDWIARTLWVYFGLFGWDLERLRSILDQACDRMGWKASSDVRFWRASSLP